MTLSKSLTGAVATGLFICAAAISLSTTSVARASPINPTRDDEVVEVLPAANGSRVEERRMRQQLASQPRNSALALAVAKRYLAQAHELGDPRFAGLAMAAIQGWPDDASAPDDVLMMKATLQQYLHEFDASVATLQALLARPGYTSGRAQAWLTLATVRRVQGRYAESDKGCQQVIQSGAELHGKACLAENAALQGKTAAARASIDALLATPALPVATQTWLTTTLAELEQRDGRVARADADFQAVLKVDRDPYTLVSYADFLIEQGRYAEAVAQLKDETRTDAVVLRLAIAGVRGQLPNAERDTKEMRDRIALANERPDAKVFHGREQSMFALWVEHQPQQALALALGNVAKQREAIDLLVLAQAAHAVGDAQQIADAKRLVASIGLHDRRVDALL